MNTDAFVAYLQGQRVTPENVLKMLAMVEALNTPPDVNTIEGILGTVGENPAMAQDMLTALNAPVIDVAAQRRAEIAELERERIAAEADRDNANRAADEARQRVVDEAAAREQAEADRLAAQNPAPSRWGQALETLDPRNWRIMGKPISWRRVAMGVTVVVIGLGAWYFWPVSESDQLTNTRPIVVQLPSAPPSVVASQPAPAIPEAASTPAPAHVELADCANTLLGDSNSGYTDKAEAISACLQAAENEAQAKVKDGDKPAEPTQADVELAAGANTLLGEPNSGNTDKGAAIS